MQMLIKNNTNYNILILAKVLLLFLQLSLGELIIV